MKEKNKTRPSSLMALTWRISALALGLWLLTMGLLTLGTAQFVQEDIRERGAELAQVMWERNFIGERAEDPRPGSLSYSMSRALRSHSLVVALPYLYDGPPGEMGSKGIFRDIWENIQVAAMFVNEKGEILRESGDYISFYYVSQEDWESQGELAPQAGFGWVELDREDPDLAPLLEKHTDVQNVYEPVAMRICGYLREGRLEPLSIDTLWNGAYNKALEEISPGWNEGDGTHEPPFTAGELDRRGLLSWDRELMREVEGYPDQEPVTIYAMRVEQSRYEPGGPVRYMDSRHEDLLSLLEKFAPGEAAGMTKEGMYQSSWLDLGSTVVFSRASGEADGGRLTLLTAVHGSPLLLAARFLRTVYILTGLVFLGAVLLLRHSLKKHLLRPLAQVAEGMARDFCHIPELREEPPRWRDVHDLVEQYFLAQQYRRCDKLEIQRLTTALDYAKTAEEKRKQQTSAVAHELKTPLAVIHSYAEGLREHIADDKRDKYLDTIIGETERMDAMVLEMLDLSRLEAGRVKLVQDSFDLGELAREVLDRLALAIEGKGLHVTCDFPEDTTVLADRSRIGQVVENFVSNAVKYAPPGGEISVRMTRQGQRLTFSVENPCDPIEADTLKRIWDAYYRADESRTAPGTGLGLTIAKTIVELHGGSCSARSTKNGVEFSFTL